MKHRAASLRQQSYLLNYKLFVVVGWLQGRSTTSTLWRRPRWTRWANRTTSTASCTTLATRSPVPRTSTRSRRAAILARPSDRRSVNASSSVAATSRRRTSSTAVQVSPVLFLQPLPPQQAALRVVPCLSVRLSTMSRFVEPRMEGISLLMYGLPVGSHHRHHVR